MQLKVEPTMLQVLMGIQYLAPAWSLPEMVPPGSMCPQDQKWFFADLPVVPLWKTQI